MGTLGGGDAAGTGVARYPCGRRGNRAICRGAGAERGEADEAAAGGHERFDYSIPQIQPGDRFSFKSGEIQRTKSSFAIVCIGDDKLGEK
jgi:hypothetical protein